MHHKKKRVHVTSSQTIATAQSRRRFGIRAHDRDTVTHRMTLKKKIELFILACSFLSTFGLLMYHPFFHINTIQVTGIERISQEEITQAAEGIIHYKKAFILPGQSYFLVHVQEIRDILKDRFPIASITVTKQFPRGISIDVTERISTIIYDNGEYYGFAGLDGTVVEVLRAVGEDEWKTQTRPATSTDEHGEPFLDQEIVSRTHTPAIKVLTSEIGEYPIVFDTRGKSARINESVLSSEAVQSIIEWYQTLKSRTTYYPKYFQIGDMDQGVIYTDQGWYIRVDFSNTAVAQQFTVLKQVIDQNDLESGQFNYVDLRYDNKVYWQ